MTNKSLFDKLQEKGVTIKVSRGYFFLSKGILIKEHRLIHPVSKSSVVCRHCGSIYDLSKVKIDHRYEECDDFTSPCCNIQGCDTRVFKRDYDTLRCYLESFNI